VSADSRLGPSPNDSRTESFLVIALAIISLAALLWYYAHNELLLYGDAVAHINIARRVIDNRSWLSSFFQLGTVWLPLQHVAMLPFVWNNVLWQSGIAGSIPAMVAYVLGGLGVFRLVSGLNPTLSPKPGDSGGAAVANPTLSPKPEDKGGAPRLMLLPACIATAIYALNPNLLYMQSTAMNEPIFLAFFIWALVYLQELFDNVNRFATGEGPRNLRAEQALERCGIALAGAAWTRYDGWFTALIIGVIVIFITIRWWRREQKPSRRRAIAKSLIEFLLLNALVPVFWLAYNHRVSGHAMDWANGPYSAKAIAQRTTERGAPPYPGENNPIVAAEYLLKAAQVNVGSATAGKVMLALALLGTAVAIWKPRRYWVWLLLWLPLIFYTLSIAYGSVPIFIPVWWPFSYYNVRYGLELLPVFAVFPVLLIASVAQLLRSYKRELAAYAALVACVAASYFSAWAETPITLREARANSRTRVAIEEGLAKFLARLPANSTVLMYESAHVGALQRAGIPLKQVVSEVSHPDWEWALLDPAGKADYIIAFDGDPVWLSAREHRGELKEVMAITVAGQARCVIYVPERS
jgi:hypothetical protein